MYPGPSGKLCIDPSVVMAKDRARRERSMHRSPLEDLRQIEGADSDPGVVSASIVRLIYASREFGAKVFDSDPRTGTYVVVLEGVLEINEREPATTAAEGAAATSTPPGPQEPPAMKLLRRVNEPDT
jgi:hypothetical protein